MAYKPMAFSYNKLTHKLTYNSSLIATCQVQLMSIFDSATYNSYNVINVKAMFTQFHNFFYYRKYLWDGIGYE